MNYLTYSKNATVSVVIPTYNEEDSISKLLEDLESLSYENIEIHIVDDASTDRTRDILENYKWLNTHLLPKNVGSPKALNSVFSKIETTYVLQLDADIRITNDSLVKEMLDEFDDETVAVWGRIGVWNDEKFPPAKMKVAKKLNESYFYGGACVMFKTEFIQRNLYDKVEGFSGADYEMREKISEKEVSKNKFTDGEMVKAVYPESFRENVRQKFRYARSFVRLMKRRFQFSKLFPMFRDWTVAGGLLILPFINLLLFSVLSALLAGYFSFRALRAKDVFQKKRFLVYSVIADFFFVFVRSAGYVREWFNAS